MKEESRTLVARALLVALAISVALSPRAALAHQAGVTEQDSPRHKVYMNVDGGGGSGKILNMRLSLGPVEWNNRRLISADVRVQFAGCSSWTNGSALYLEFTPLNDTGGMMFENWWQIETASASNSSCSEGLYTRHVNFQDMSYPNYAVRLTPYEDSGLAWQTRRVFAQDSTIPPLPVSTCESAELAFSNVVGTTDASGTSIRFKFTGPSQIGWNVYWPSPTARPYGTPKLEVPPEQLVGYNGSYGATTTVTTTATDFLIAYKADDKCYVEGNFNSGSTTGDEIVDETGATCGRWNFFCWIKAAFIWAFKPTEATSAAWNQTKDLLKTKTPFKEVHDGGQAIDEGLGSLQLRNRANVPPEHGSGCLDDGEHIPGFCLDSVASTFGQTTGTGSGYLAFLRIIIGAAVLLAFLFRVWSSAVSLLGGRGQDPSTPQADTGVRG